jgi:peroxiredoxin Q/BCP
MKIDDFSAVSTDGTFKLSAHKGDTVVLYYYPRDNTPGCTTEGADFRDRYARFRKAGAEIDGVARGALSDHLYSNA